MRGVQRVFAVVAAILWIGPAGILPGTAFSQADATDETSEGSTDTGASDPAVSTSEPAPRESASAGSAGSDASGAMQSRIHGLLVVDLGNAEFAAKASPMNATAIPSKADSPVSLRFNQPVGEQMTSALNEVQKCLTVRYGKWPQGYDVEFAFEDRYSGKDGPSAAVACALLVDSLFSRRPLDPRVAVTGDLNADGSVQPVGGVAAKIRGAAARECDVVGIPFRNAATVSDMLILDGPERLYQVQIFALKTFDEARELAAAARSAELQKAIEAFGEIRAALERNSRQAFQLLQHPATQAKLRGIVSVAPNHLSARLLMLHGLGRAPQELSLAGSLSYLDRTAAVLVDAARSGRFGADSALEPDHIADAVTQMRSIRRRLDSRIWPYADALEGFGALLRKFVNTPGSSTAARNKLAEELLTAARKIDHEIGLLRRNREIIEELMD